MSKDLRDRDYLEHIQDAIGKIQRYVAGMSEAEFMVDDLVQDAVIRNLEIIGEAVTKLSPELKARHDDVAWGESPACATACSRLRYSEPPDRLGYCREDTAGLSGEGGRFQRAL